MSASYTRRSLSVVIGLLFVALIAGLAANPVAAQTVPGQAPGVVASGYGRASAPATSADVQIVLGPSWYGGFGMMDPSVEVIPAEDAPPVASPIAGEPDSGMMIDPGMAMGQPAMLTEGDIAPVVDAIVAAGVARDDIDVLVPGFTSTFTGPGGPDSAQVRFSLESPVVSELSTLVQAVQTAATDAGLGVQHVGVRYDGANCDALVQDARAAAVADARMRAEGLAQALGAELGALTQAADNLFYGYGDQACGPELPDDFGPFGPGMEPPFDATAPAEVVVYAQVTLTYELVVTAEATPSA